MKTIRVREGQNIIDIALQYYGDVEGASNLIQDNNLSLTDALEAGTILHIDEQNLMDELITEYYDNNSVIVNTGAPAQDIPGEFNNDFNFDFKKTAE